MSNDGGFSIEEDTISMHFDGNPGTFGSSVQETLLDEAQFVLDYARESAPWADRTGAARSGLDVDVYEENGNVDLVLFHTVDYGLWLEVIQSGRYAVIMPTLEALAPLIFKSVNAVYTGVSGGDA